MKLKNGKRMKKNKIYKNECSNNDGNNVRFWNA